MNVIMALVVVVVETSDGDAQWRGIRRIWRTAGRQKRLNDVAVDTDGVDYKREQGDRQGGSHKACLRRPNLSKIQ